MSPRMDVDRRDYKLHTVAPTLCSLGMKSKSNVIEFSSIITSTCSIPPDLGRRTRGRWTCLKTNDDTSESTTVRDNKQTNKREKTRNKAMV